VSKPDSAEDNNNDAETSKPWWRDPTPTIVFCFLGVLAVAILVSVISPPIGYAGQLDKIIEQQQTMIQLLTDILNEEQAAHGQTQRK